MENTVKVGLISVGLETYWSQFEGLLPRLEKYHSIINGKLQNDNAEIIDLGMIDSVMKANNASKKLASENIDILFIFISTYALSSVILPIVRNLNRPVILLNVQPVAAIDYDAINSMNDRGKMTGEWLAHCQACSLPEFACVMNSAHIKYNIVTGFLDDDNVWKQTKSWIDAAYVVSGMRNNRLGILGHYYNGMVDVYTDLRKQSTTFGTHVEVMEMCELKALCDSVTQNEIARKREEFNEYFDVIPECEENELDRAARVSVGLDKLTSKHDLGSMAYYYESENGTEIQDIVTAVIPGNTILTGKGLPVAGECEVKNVQAMKILSLLGAGGSFSEFYAMDFNDDIVMLGHDGPAHFNIAEGRVKLVPVPVFHGKPGKGLSIQMSVHHGPVTLLSVVESNDGIMLLCAEGECVDGPVLHIGNTNSRYRFNCGARSFIERWSMAGPSHHCAIGIGHLADELKKVAFLLDLPITIIE